MSNALKKEFPTLMAAYRNEVIREVLAAAERIYIESDYDDADSEDAGLFLDAVFVAFGFDPAECLNEDLA